MTTEIVGFNIERAQKAASDFLRSYHGVSYCDLSIDERYLADTLMTKASEVLSDLNLLTKPMFDVEDGCYVLLRTVHTTVEPINLRLLSYLKKIGRNLNLRVDVGQEVYWDFDGISDIAKARYLITVSLMFDPHQLVD